MQSAVETTINEATAEVATETKETTLLLSSSKQEQTKKEQKKEQKEQTKPGFFVLRKKGLYNSWNPVALYDNETGYFKGVAYFSGLWECVQYKKKCEDKAIKNFLKEGKGSIYGKNNTIGKHRGMMNENMYKIFIEHEIPSIKPQFLR